MKGSRYFDSSAWFKRYFQESGSAELRTLLAGAEEVCLCEVGIPEIFSVLRRQVRERVISEAQYAALKRAVGEDLRAVAVLPVDSAVVGEAIACLEGAALQGCDSIHVAAARLHGCDLFVSADRQQCRAARALGLKVQAV